MLPRADHDLTDAGLAGAPERFAEESVGFASGFLRRKVVGPVDVAWVDRREVDEVEDVDAMRGLDVRLLEIRFGQHDVLAVVVLVSLDDLLPRHGLARP